MFNKYLEYHQPLMSDKKFNDLTIVKNMLLLKDTLPDSNMTNPTKRAKI